jgi:polyisoprenoid-binding protein YceI
MLLPLLLLSTLPLMSPPQRDAVRVDAREGSRVWIEGSSNVHDWSCRAEAFEASVDVDPKREERNGTAIRRVNVRLNARDLKCGNRKMEHDLYATLRANDKANPSYIVADFQPVPGSTNATQGNVAVVGVERPVTIQINIERMPDGTMKASGAIPLLMTDFGITPPTGLFGLIRSRNEITVKFDLIVGPRGVATP